MKRLKKLVAQWVTKHPYTSAYLAGVIYYSLAVSWLKDVRTAELIQNDSIAKVVGVSAYLLCVFVFAVIMPFCLYLYRRLNLNISKVSFVWLAPTVWLVGELMRSVLFSLATMGPGGRVGDYWNFGALGYFLINTPLVYAARLGGLYLLSAIVACLFASLAYGFKAKRWLPFLMVIIGASLLSLIGWQSYKSANGPTVNVLAVNIKTKSEGKSQIQEILGSIPKNSADVVVLPEYSNFWQSDNTSQTAIMQHLIKTNGGTVVTSTKNYQPVKTTNDIQFTNSSGQVVFSQAKWFLVPGGEFVPYIYQALLVATGQSHLIEKFNTTRGITPANNREQVFKRDNVAFGSLVCSGVNVLSLYRNLASQGATILTNSASVGILGGSHGYSQASSNLAKLQAVANARPFVQSARGGTSFVYDHNGKLLAKTGLSTNSHVQESVRTNSKRTLYTVLGEWVVWLAIVVIAAKSLRQKH